MLEVAAKGGFGEASGARGLAEDASSRNLLLVDDIMGGAVEVTVVDDGARAVAAIEFCATVFCKDAETDTAIDLTFDVTFYRTI